MNGPRRGRIAYWISLILPPVILGSAALYLLLVWDRLPQELPTSFDLAGRPTEWGSKSQLWVLLGVGLASYVLMTAAAFFPKTWKPGVRVTVFNQELVYRLMRELFGELRVCFLLLFAGLSVWCSRGGPGPGWLVSAASLVLTVGPIVRYLLRIYVFRR